MTRWSRGRRLHRRRPRRLRRPQPRDRAFFVHRNLGNGTFAQTVTWGRRRRGGRWVGGARRGFHGRRRRRLPTATSRPGVRAPQPPRRDLRRLTERWGRGLSHAGSGWETVVADFTGDRYADYADRNLATGEMWIHENLRNGTFAEAATLNRVWGCKTAGGVEVRHHHRRRLHRRRLRGLRRREPHLPHLLRPREPRNGAFAGFGVNWGRPCTRRSSSASTRGRPGTGDPATAATALRRRCPAPIERATLLFARNCPTFDAAPRMPVASVAEDVAVLPPFRPGMRGGSAAWRGLAASTWIGLASGSSAACAETTVATVGALGVMLALRIAWRAPTRASRPRRRAPASPGPTASVDPVGAVELMRLAAGEVTTARGVVRVSYAAGRRRPRPPRRLRRPHAPRLAAPPHRWRATRRPRRRRSGAALGAIAERVDAREFLPPEGDMGRRSLRGRGSASPLAACGSRWRRPRAAGGGARRGTSTPSPRRPARGDGVVGPCLVARAALQRRHASPEESSPAALVAASAAALAVAAPGPREVGAWSLAAASRSRFPAWPLPGAWLARRGAAARGRARRARGRAGGAPGGRGVGLGSGMLPPTAPGGGGLRPRGPRRRDDTRASRRCRASATGRRSTRASARRCAPVGPDEIGVDLSAVDVVELLRDASAWRRRARARARRGRDGRGGAAATRLPWGWRVAPRCAPPVACSAVTVTGDARFCYRPRPDDPPRDQLQRRPRGPSLCPCARAGPRRAPSTSRGPACPSWSTATAEGLRGRSLRGDGAPARAVRTPSRTR